MFFIAFHYLSLPRIAFHFVSLLFFAFHCFSLVLIALHCFSFGFGHFSMLFIEAVCYSTHFIGRHCITKPLTFVEDRKLRNEETPVAGACSKPATSSTPAGRVVFLPLRGFSLYCSSSSPSPPWLTLADPVLDFLLHTYFDPCVKNRLMQQQGVR